MRICFIIEYYHPHIGGAEVLFQKLAEGLAKLGHTCEVVTCHLPGAKRDEVINGVSVHRVWVPLIGDRYWFTVLALAASWKYSREADIIHTMTYNGALPAWIVARLRNKPVVMLAHEVIGQKWRTIGISKIASMLYQFIESTVLRIPYDAYSCNSRTTMKSIEALGIPVDKLFLAYPGIDYVLFDPAHYDGERQRIRRILGISDDCFLYTFYGRPGYVKGVEFLVRAVPRVKSRIASSKLLLILSHKPAAGHRRIRDIVRTLKLRLGEDIIIQDPVPRQELPSYILASDAIVVPSLSEGFGFTCVEACTMQRPVVATRAGSLPEVIFGNYVLVEPGNADALGEGIVRLKEKDYTHSEEKRYSWDNHVQTHISAYHALLKNNT